jgi:hypothetical protein
MLNHICTKHHPHNPMKKPILLISVTLLTIALVYALVRYVGLLGFGAAFSLNFLLMACTFLFTEALKSPFASTYFDAKPWERGGKVYERLGVHAYRKLLVWTGWEKLNKPSKPVTKSTNALQYLHYRPRQDELSHSVILVIVAGFTVFVAATAGSYPRLTHQRSENPAPSLTQEIRCTP